MFRVRARAGDSINGAGGNSAATTVQMRRGQTLSRKGPISPSQCALSTRSMGLVFIHEQVLRGLAVRTRRPRRLAKVLEAGQVGAQSRRRCGEGREREGCAEARGRAAPGHLRLLFLL